jgi:hypothetical protein
MAELDDFRALLEKVEALITDAVEEGPPDPKRTVREVFQRRADGLFKLRRAEALLTEGLTASRCTPACSNAVATSAS